MKKISKGIYYAYSEKTGTHYNIIKGKRFWLAQDIITGRPRGHYSTLKIAKEFIEEGVI